MSEFNMYHALGQENDASGKSGPNAAPNQFRPPVAPSPYQQQTGSTFQPPAQQHYDNPSQAAPMNPQNYYQTAQPFQQPGFPQQTGLEGQLGGLALGENAAPSRAGRKKNDRHAYHALEALPGSSAAFNGTPPPGAPSTGFLNADPSLQQSRFQDPRNLSQFPVAASAPFNPANLASSAQFATRQGPSIGVQTSAQGRIDPEEIPSVPRSRDIVASYFLKNVYPTSEHHTPPPAVTSFVAFDQGNASPKFARLTFNNIPTTAEALKSTHLPLGLLLQPLAPLQPGELEIPVLDFGETGPPRCRRCRAYMNPFMVFSSGGNKFTCNLCTYPNEVPSEYFCATTPQGVRVDREQRPELMRGTVEYLVPKEYWSKEPVGLNWLFLVDVCQESLNRNFLEGFCEGILAALYGVGEDASANGDGEHRNLPAGSKVGFMTFDKDIHFYNCNPALDQAQMMVMPDIEDPFVPLSEGLFVDPYESRPIITALLNQLPAIFSQVKNPEPALLPTLNAALAALEKTGGKIICSLAALPTWGPGRLFLRDNGKLQSAENDKKLFTTEHPGWKKTAEKMVTSGVGVDFFLAAPGGGYLDIATIGHVSASTGGDTFFYPNFVSPRDTSKLSQEIVHSVRRETGFQALMKVRCSNGLQVSSYHGNFIHHTFGADLELGVIDSDKALGVLFSYDGKLDPKLDAHFQSALLYTAASGERRVRCSNVVASVSDVMKECMRYVDQDAVYNLMAKEAASKVLSTPLKDIRNAITERNIDILAGYRKNFSGSHPPGQLVLPENLKEFTMYALGLLKSRAFKGGQEPSDRRIHDLRMIKSMGALELSLYLYPRIIPLHNLSPEDGFSNAEGHFNMPPSIRASFAKVEEGGVYLVDNGQSCYLWLHAQTSPNLLVDLFGEGKDSLKVLDAYMSVLPVLDTHLSAQVRNIIEYLKTVRGSKALTIQLARQGLDGAEYEFARLLVEDRNNEAQSYVDFLVHIHRHVQLELTGQRKKDESGDSGVSNFAGLRPPYW